MADMRIKLSGAEFWPSRGDDGSVIPQYELRYNAQGIVPLQQTTTAGNIVNYAVPTDWPITVFNDTSSTTREFVVREKYSDRIFVFHDFSTAKSGGIRGRLAEITTRQWYDASPRIYGYTFSYAVDGRLLQITPPAPQNNIRIVYKYLGALPDKISSVQVYKGIETPTNLLMKADYLYWDDVPSPGTFLGHTGCLVQVKISTRDSNDSGEVLSKTRYTQYRYETQPENYSYLYDDQGVLRSIYDDDAIARMVADSSAATSPEDLLELDEDDSEFPMLPYASRWFEYFPYFNQDNTTNVTTWGEVENLESKYGGADYWESHECRVKAEHIRRGCTSCSGGNATGITRLYHYMHVWPVPETPPYYQWWIWHSDSFWQLTGHAPRDINETRHLVVEDTITYDNPEAPEGRPLYRKIYALNDFSRKLREVVIEKPTDETLKCWCWAWTYVKADTNGDGRFTLDANSDGDFLDPADDHPHLKHLVAEYRLPSAYNVASDESLKDFLNPYYRDRSNNTDDWSNDEAVLRSSDGLIYQYEYENSLGLRTGEKVKNGRTEIAHYVAATDWGDGSNDCPKDRKIAVYTYPSPGLSREHGTKTEFTYSFWDSGDRILKSRTTKVPAVTESENGPASGSHYPYVCEVVALQEFYDSKGRLRWTKDGEGYVNYYSYNPSTGGVAFEVLDVANSFTNSGVSGKYVSDSDAGAVDIRPTRAGDLPIALERTTIIEFDSNGREMLRCEPGGAKHCTIYEHDDGIDRVIQLPYWNDSTHQTLLPIAVREYNREGRLAYQWLAPIGTSVDLDDVDVPIGISSVDWEDRIEATYYFYDEASGRPREIRRLHNVDIAGAGLAENEFSHFYSTRFIYDAEGRIGATVAGVSADRYQVMVTRYDVLGRPIELRSAVVDAPPISYAELVDPNDPDAVPEGFALVSQKIYDEDGIGDGHVTQQLIVNTLDESDNPDAYTLVNYYRTFRGHLRGVKQQYHDGTSTSDISPCTAIDVDWLGRTVASAIYTSEPAWTSLAASYGAWVSEPSGASGRHSLTLYVFDVLGRKFKTKHFPHESSSAIQSNRFYDGNGRLVCTGQLGSAFTEIAYDGVGRQYQVRTITDVDTDPYLGNGRFNYQAPLPDPHWKADVSGLNVSTVRSGAMAGGNDGVIEIAHSVFDVRGRTVQQHMFELTHNDSSIGINMTNIDYVRQSSYNWFDDADRLICTANFGSGDSSSGAGAWKYSSVPGYASSPLTASDHAKLVRRFSYNSFSGRQEIATSSGGNKTKSVYDAIGRRVAYIENQDNCDGPSDSSDIGGGTNNDKDRLTTLSYNGYGNLVKVRAYTSSSAYQETDYAYLDDFNASLVTHVISPDATSRTFEAVFDDSADQVRNEYDIDGTLKRKKDQRDVVISYGYDDHRREVLESATSIPSSVDDYIRSIRRSYDNLGRVERVTSCSDVNGSIAKNEIKYNYDATLGLLTQTDQDHVDAVGSGTSHQSVAYAYATAADGNLFTDNLRARMTTYPSGRKIHSTYAAPDTVSDRLNRVEKLQADNGSNEPGSILTHYDYNGASRLVRISYPGPAIDQRNYNLYSQGLNNYNGFDRFGRTKELVWWYTPGPGAYKDSFKYQYDLNGNRSERRIDASLYPTNDHDQMFTYDGLQRLTAVKIGRVEFGDIDGADLLRKQNWTHSQMGGWKTFEEFTYENGEEQYYANPIGTLNSANELTGIANSGWSSPIYDNAGNITSLPSPVNPTVDSFGLRYDAWNRLVSVDSGVTPVLRMRYDGLGRRIQKLVAVPAGGRGGGYTYVPDDYFYNEQWQLLEIRHNSSSNPREQFLWHSHYVDALAIRFYDGNSDGSMAGTNEGPQYFQHDANFNVTAVANSTGGIIERYRYTPYGEVAFLNSTFSGAGTSSIIGNSNLFTGRERDAETGLQLNRRRWYASNLSRWLTRDPLGLVAGTNLYEMGASNPIMKGVDPSGLLCSTESHGVDFSTGPGDDTLWKIISNKFPVNVEFSGQIQCESSTCQADCGCKKSATEVKGSCGFGLSIGLTISTLPEGVWAEGGGSFSVTGTRTWKYGGCNNESYDQMCGNYSGQAYAKVCGGIEWVATMCVGFRYKCQNSFCGPSGGDRNGISTDSLAAGFSNGCTFELFGEVCGFIWCEEVGISMDEFLE